MVGLPVQATFHAVVFIHMVDGDVVNWIQLDRVDQLDLLDQHRSHEQAVAATRPQLRA